MNYEHAWNELQDRLIACHMRCDDCQMEEAEDVQSSIGAVLDIMDEIEEEGFVRVVHCL